MYAIAMTAAVALLAALPWAAQAQSHDAKGRRPTASFSTPEVPVSGRMVLRDRSSELLATQTPGLLAARPDIRWRRNAERARAEGRDRQAYLGFRRAARYGDKASQSILARMHRNGAGATQDPVAAYAWMAVAAERGDPAYARLRDRYRDRLDANQRAQADAQARALMAEYGDAEALPRLRKRIRMARHEATGSRLGFGGMLEITATNGSRDAQGPSMSGADYYDRRYWQSPRPDNTAAGEDDLKQDHTGSR